MNLLEGTALNVREEPSAEKGGPILGQQANFNSGKVLAGPRNTANGATWWQVDFTTGIDGWVFEDYIAK